MGNRYASLPISKQEGICLTWNLELRMAVNKTDTALGALP